MVRVSLANPAGFKYVNEGGEHCTTLEDVIKGNSFFLSLGVHGCMIATSGQMKPAESVSLSNMLWLHLCRICTVLSPLVQVCPA